MIASVFVYGTLKQGQCRQSHWPHPPLSIQVGWVRGSLYGRSDYPALRPGEDRVLGERWQFDQGLITAVLKRLDQIEGTNQPGHEDEYRRIVTPVMSLESGEWLGDAWCYLYAADPANLGFARVQAEQKGPVQWP